MIPPLHALYGGSGDPRRAWQEAPAPLPSQMTAAAFETTCRNMHLSELLASRADPAWWNVRSWVWTEPALYANDAVRVIPCPR